LDPEEEKEKKDKGFEEVGIGAFGFQETQVSNEIDFATGAVLVDVAIADVWKGENVLSPTSYADVLYTEDGENIKHLAVKSTYWPSDIRREFSRIKQAESEEIAVFYARGQGGVNRSGTRRSSPMNMPGGPMGPMGPMGGGMGPMGPMGY